jgi:membrane protein required for colicin V production
MHLTQFDLIVLGLLAISGLFGFLRGAMREIVALVALVVASATAVFSLHWSAPIAHHAIKTGWLATATALIVVFVAVYLALRLVGAMIAGQLQQSDFVGALDRSLGLAIGLLRGLIILGAFNLAFLAATPEDLRPHWIVGASSWPLAQDMGRALTAIAPKGLDIAGRLKPAFDRAVHGAARDAVDDRLKSEGYDAAQRREIEDLVEKSR